MTPITSVVFIVLLMFTSAGPVIRVGTVEDLDTCNKMAAQTEILVNTTTTVPDSVGGKQEVVISDATAWCHTATLRAHASVSPSGVDRSSVVSR